MSDEVTRVLDAASDAAIEVALGVPIIAVREIVRSVFLTLDDLIEEAADAGRGWPDVGDLALLSKDIPTVL